MSKWQKLALFNEKCILENRSCRKADYVYDENNDTKLSIIDFDDTNKFLLKFSTNQANRKKFIHQLNTFYIGNEEYPCRCRIKLQMSSFKNDNGLQMSIILLETGSLDKWQLFLGAIDKTLPCDEKLGNELLNLLGKISKDKRWKRIESLIDAVPSNPSSFDQAFGMTLNTETRMRLGEYCETKQQFQNAITCYGSISPEGENYKNAQEKIAHIYMQLTNLAEMNNTPLSAEEKQHYQEQAFKHQLKAGTNQRLVDQLYNSLSGAELSEIPIKDIGLDIETLINIASRDRNIREGNKRLKKENEELRRQLSVTNTNGTLLASASLNTHGIFAQATIFNSVNQDCPKGDASKKRRLSF